MKLDFWKFEDGMTRLVLSDQQLKIIMYSLEEANQTELEQAIREILESKEIRPVWKTTIP